MKQIIKKIILSFFGNNALKNLRTTITAIKFKSIKYLFYNIKDDLQLQSEDADLSRALNSPDHYLEKACVYENAFNINATSIEVIEEGEVKLDNQDWLVISKVKIKFI